MLRSACARPPSRPYALTCLHVCAKKTSMANTRKQHALADMGTARAGRCRACAHEGHVQERAWRTQARKKDTRTQRAFSTLVFGDIDLCYRLCLWNMHNAQSKARAGGLYVDHPGYCFVAQVCSRCASARRPLLSCFATLLAVLEVPIALVLEVPISFGSVGMPASRRILT